MRLCNPPDMSKIKPSKYESSYVFLGGERVIFLKENITKEVAAELSALLIYYDHESTEEPIDLYIHCNGGDADGLTNIYDVMNFITAPVSTICIGKAYSAGAVLLSAGTKGMRAAFKNSKIMIHGIQCTFPIPGHDQSESKNYLAFLKKANNNIMKMLAKNTDQPLNKIQEDCKRDLYMGANEAIDYGLIDFII